ncbi:DUF1684 domain-containing protein [Streptomyces lichenis]|uniref:DUF1684 domain-containing protein n=1 Tax=Streptomyces lichenis TaxID=2306967 RepID=A0ABT0IIW1_9ACTN|nr:DUF1684 domain-containing protein [Streptomyces lichenis]MCK8681195.1 DUF1684 domain-containing protein [Streptomyces lichenis]
MSSDPVQDWKQWHEQRTAAVSAPYGPLALTGTYWLSDHPDGRLPGVPGLWRDAGEHVHLTAAPADGLTADGRPVDGELRLTAEQSLPEHASLAAGDRRLVVLRREGQWAVRDFDPASPARRAFQGIEATPYDEQWAVPGVFTAYDGEQRVRVENADGRERGLGLGGELVFTLAGTEHTLRVAVEDDGSLWAVFADATGADGSSYRFRFLRPGAPEADGTITVDLNRALLPPCAFADHFICPFPPPGNTLDVPVAAGERRVRAR